MAASSARPPAPGKSGARIYVSGPAAEKALTLREFGLDIRAVDGGIGAASALKCSYAALTKGTQALGVALMLGAMRAGVAPALRQESEREPAGASPPSSRARSRTCITRPIAGSPRWRRSASIWARAEPGARDIYRGMARLYEHLGPDQIAALDEFLER